MRCIFRLSPQSGVNGPVLDGIFHQHDADGDGKLNRQEVRTAAAVIMEMHNQALAPEVRFSARWHCYMKIFTI